MSRRTEMRKKYCEWDGDCEHCGAADCIARPSQCARFNTRDHCTENDIKRACFKEIPGYVNMNGAKVIFHGKAMRFC